MKKIIHGIPKLYTNMSENYMFPCAMSVVMRFLGESTDYDFTFFSAVTGDLFCQVAHIYPAFGFNDSFSNEAKDTNEPIMRAFAACGYTCKIIAREEIATDRAKWLSRIKESIDSGMPVLSFGSVGPENCAVISGYDDDGEALYGWSQFQDIEPQYKSTLEESPEGYFRREKMIDCSHMLVFICEKHPAPPIDAVWRDVIAKIPEWSVMPDINGGAARSFGARAFFSWARALLDDDRFVDESKYDELADTHQGLLCIEATNMHYIGEVLERMEQNCPDLITRITELKDIYAVQKELNDTIFALQGGFIIPKEKLYDSGCRARLAEIINDIGKLTAKLAV